MICKKTRTLRVASSAVCALYYVVISRCLSKHLVSLPKKTCASVAVFVCRLDPLLLLTSFAVEILFPSVSNLFCQIPSLGHLNLPTLVVSIFRRRHRLLCFHLSLSVNISPLLSRCSFFASTIFFIHALLSPLPLYNYNCSNLLLSLVG